MSINAKQGVFPAIMTETHASEFVQPFWDAAKKDKLVSARCTNCGAFRLPPGPFCFECQHREIEWVELPGTGRVYSFVVVRHPLAEILQPAVPYASGIVELDGTQGAGSRMIVNFIDCDVDTLQIGDEVEADFEHVNDEMTVIRFRPKR
jgi:uncharacterized OB-fold protein